jgi:MoxR-like ATPase
MSAPSQELMNEIERQSQKLTQLRQETAKVIVGQSYMIDRLLMGLIADGASW